MHRFCIRKTFRTQTQISKATLTAISFEETHVINSAQLNFTRDSQRPLCHFSSDGQTRCHVPHLASSLLLYWICKKRKQKEQEYLTRNLMTSSNSSELSLELEHITDGYIIVNNVFFIATAVQDFFFFRTFLN